DLDFGNGLHLFVTRERGASPGAGNLRPQVGLPSLYATFEAVGWHERVQSWSAFSCAPGCSPPSPTDGAFLRRSSRRPRRMGAGTVAAVTAVGGTEAATMA